MTAENWQYDARLAKRWNIDPLYKKYAGQSPYACLNNNPVLYNDPTGESGEVTIDKESKTLTIKQTIILYGSKANSQLASQTAKDVEDAWNAANGKVMINGEEYSVKFSVSSGYLSGKYDDILGNVTKDIIERITNIENNYIRVEETVAGNISYMDAAGSNTGYFLLSNIKSDGSTTEAHEIGHGYGLDHPETADLRGKGQPGIMAARGTLVDSQYQYDPNAKPGKAGGTINPEKRKVTQQDINNLGLDKLKFDNKGKANLGKLTNKYHEKTK